MVNALLISIGNELLSGQTVNTNATFLAEDLTKLGFSIKKIITLPDDNRIVSNELRKALNSKEYKLIIVTGGLGPTWDDSTSQFLANALNAPLNLNAKALDIVKERYSALFKEGLVETSEMTPAREKMAYLPEGTIPIYNPVGTAPGIYYNHLQTNVRIYCLPGVPKEMIEMYRRIQPDLTTFGSIEGRYYFETEFLTPFKDESLLAPYLQKVRERYDVWIKSLPQSYQEEKQIRLIISTNGDSEKDVKLAVLGALDFLKSLMQTSKKV